MDGSLENRSKRRRSLRAKILLLACFGVAASLYMSAQTDRPAGPSAAPAGAFEVISIKPSHAPNGNGGWWTLPDGFRYRNMPLRSLIYSAYDMIMESQVAGMPGWADSDPYDIDGKVDAETAAAWKDLPPKERWMQEKPMLQALLADRCAFKAHLETKELPVYDLVIAKGGLKMKEAPGEEKSSYSWSSGSSGSTMSAHATTVDNAATSLSSSVGRVIVDKTGLGERKFDFELKWTPDDQRAADPDNAGPSLFTELEEQLGLKLVSSKGPVEVLVIDHMERPSPN